MRCSKFVDKSECWHKADTISSKLTSFNTQVSAIIKNLLLKDWAEIDPDYFADSPFNTEGNRKFSSACFWFLTSMLYYRHLSNDDWTDLFELFSTRLFSTPDKLKPVPVIQPKLEMNYIGKQPIKRGKSLNRKLESHSSVGKSLSAANNHLQCESELGTYTLSDDIALLQLRMRVQKLGQRSKIESEIDSNHTTTACKHNQPQQSEYRELLQTRNKSPVLITQFYAKPSPTVKQEPQEPEEYFVTPVKQEMISGSSSWRASKRRVDFCLGVELTDSQKRVSLTQLIELLQTEHAQSQQEISAQLQKLRLKAQFESNNLIGEYMTLAKKDIEQQNTSALMGKLPGPIGLIFQNIYQHISSEEEKIFKKLREMDLKSNTKKLATLQGDQNRSNQDQASLPLQFRSQGDMSGKSRLMKDSMNQRSKFAGSHMSPQATKGLASKALAPRSNLLLEDDKCQVCGDGDYTDHNLIVYCAKCNICCHQLCYGLESIPKGNWVCDLCRYYGINGRGMRCPLCPRVGGIMRRCSLKSTDHFWNRFSPEYLSYIKSDEIDPPEEPPRLFAEDIVVFESMTITGDFKTHLYYDYFGCLAAGVNCPASPRPYLAWIHLCCLPQNTDLKPFTAPPKGTQKYQYHLTIPFELPEIFPINHRVPWLCKEVQLVPPQLAKSSRDGDSVKLGRSGVKTLMGLVPLDQAIQVPNLQPKSSRLELDQSACTAEPEFPAPKLGSRPRTRAECRSTSKKSLLVEDKFEQRESAAKTPKHRVVIHQPILQKVELRPSLLRPHPNKIQQQQSALAESPILQVYRPSSCPTDEKELLKTFESASRSAIGGDSEVFQEFVLPCTCCQLATGFLFSCPKCNRATHGSCGVLVGAKRTGDRVSCREHTEDEILNLLRSCQEKHKTEILTWLGLEEEGLELEKSIRELRNISKQIRDHTQEITETTLQKHEVIHKTGRGKPNRFSKKNSLVPAESGGCNRVVIYLNKKFETKSDKSSKHKGYQRSPTYVFQDIRIGPIQNDPPVADQVVSSLPKEKYEISERLNFCKSDSPQHPKIEFLATKNQPESPPLKEMTSFEARSPISLNEIAAQTSAVMPKTYFRLTKFETELKIETNDNDPCDNHLAIQSSPNVQKPDSVSATNGKKSVQEPTLELTIHLKREHAHWDSQATSTQPEIKLPISEHVKLKIESTFKLQPPEVQAAEDQQMSPNRIVEIKKEPLATQDEFSSPKTVALRETQESKSNNAEVNTPAKQENQALNTMQCLLSGRADSATKLEVCTTQVKISPSATRAKSSLAESPRVQHKTVGNSQSKSRQRQPESELNWQMLNKRTVVMSDFANDSQPVAGENVSLPVYKEPAALLPNPQISTLQAVPLLLDPLPNMATPPRFCVSLAPSQDVLCPTAEDWEGMFNLYLREQEEKTRKQQSPAGPADKHSRTIVTSIKMPFSQRTPRQAGSSRLQSRNNLRPN